MDILINSVVPDPLKGVYSNESLWGKDISFSVGKYYIIKAPSGKGKSTLISYIYGLRNDYSGSIFLGQQNASELTLDDWASFRQNTLSIVFQDLRLFEDLSALENIQIKQQLTHTVTNEEVREMAELLDVSNLLDKKIRYCSMGQQQRIAIIRALSQPFKWLMLDEPFSHLDDKNIAKLEQLIDGICKKNSAGLILTSLGNDSRLNMDKLITI